jgi:O-antigen/teichoic acid export membrane protein
MGREVNATLRFYLFALPLLMASIMAFGEPLVWLILSEQFMPVAPLLLIFVPAELLRIMAETMSVPFLARRRTIGFTGLYVLQAALFVASAVLLVPRSGLAGGGFAYAIGATAGALATGLAIRRAFAIELERATVGALLRALILLGGVALFSFYLPFGVARLAVAAGLGALWLGLALRDDSGKTALRRLRATLLGPATNGVGK